MKPYAIAKSFTFAAAHHLPLLPAAHKCHRPHGHNYEVTLVLAAVELDSYGFVVDYAHMGRFADMLANRYDHRDLNAQLDCEPTAENLAVVLYDAAVEMYGDLVESVRVAETPRTWAEYRG